MVLSLRLRDGASSPWKAPDREPGEPCYLIPCRFFTALQLEALSPARERE